MDYKITWHSRQASPIDQGTVRAVWTMDKGASSYDTYPEQTEDIAKFLNNEKVKPEEIIYFMMRESGFSRNIYKLLEPHEWPVKNVPLCNESANDCLFAINYIYQPCTHHDKRLAFESDLTSEKIIEAIGERKLDSSQYTIFRQRSNDENTLVKLNPDDPRWPMKYQWVAK